MKRAGVIGDLHLDNKNIGQHRDYYSECIKICEDITQYIEERQLDILIFTGDFTNRNINEYVGLYTFLKYFAEWNSKLQGEVYAIQGNHDVGATPRLFQLLEASNLIKTYITDSKVCSYIDIEGVRIHLMNYGETQRDLQLKDMEEYSNVVISHADWEVDGKTTWYGGVNAGAIRLNEAENLRGVDLLINGHIHRPTDGFINEYIQGCNTPINFINLGCATRPGKEQNIWEKVYFVDFDCQEGVIHNTYVKEYMLPSLEESFVEEKQIEIDNSREVSIEELKNVLQDLQVVQAVTQATLRDKIKRLAGLDKIACNIVLETLEEVENELKTK